MGAWTDQHIEGTARAPSALAESSELVVREKKCTPAQHVAIERPLAIALSPPINFGVVTEGLYRSSYPQTVDYPFIQQLKLKTLVTLVDKEFPDGFQKFLEAHGVRHIVFDMAGTKKAAIPIDTMRSVQALITDKRNYPLLMHCNQGKHRTGCVVGVHRKIIGGWDTERVLAEYASFAEPKVRETDVRYLTEFNPWTIEKRGPARLPDVVGRKLILVILVWVLLCIHLTTLRRLKHNPEASSPMPSEKVLSA